MDISILLEKTKLEREGYITLIIYVTLIEGCLIEKDTPIEQFGFLMAVLGSTSRPTTVNKLVVIDLQRIFTPLFITIDMFDLYVPYLFAF